MHSMAPTPGTPGLFRGLTLADRVALSDPEAVRLYRRKVALAEIRVRQIGRRQRLRSWLR